MQPLLPQPGRLPRRGFTLVELLVVISILLILTAMTIGTINLTVTGERVRSGARQVQSLIEGSRDRAIYANAARGIRILVDENITEDHDGNLSTPEIATTAATIVYIGSPGAYESEPDVDDADNDGDRQEPDPAGPFVNVLNPNPGQFPFDTPPPTPPTIVQRVLIGVGTRFSELYEQKLIRAGSRIRLGRDSLGEAQNSTELLTIHPASFPVRTENEWFNQSTGIIPTGIASGNMNGTAGSGSGDEVLFLSTASDLVEQHGLGVTAPPFALPGNWHFSIETDADHLPGEEPSVLPRNCCIDLETSHLPADWVTFNASTGAKQFSNRMDLMFSPNGSIIGTPGAAGVIHLHVSHTQDALDNVPPGSQTLNGAPDGDPRQGDEFGVTIFTRTGRVIVHPIDWAGYLVPANTARNLSFDDAGDFDGNANTKGYWQPNTSYGVGDVVAPHLYDGNVYVAVSSSASTGSYNPQTEPTWNRVSGGLTVDSGVIWQARRHNVWRMGLEGEQAR